MFSLGKVGEFLFNITELYVQANVNWGTDREICPVHDSCAVMIAVNPQVFTHKRVAYVDVETEGELTCGMTIADWKGTHWNKTPQTTGLCTQGFYVQ